MVGINWYFGESRMTGSYFDRVIKAIADDSHFSKLADMLIKRQKARIQLYATEKTFHGNMISLDHAYLLGHAFDGGDFPIQPGFFDFFPARVCKAFQHGIYGIAYGEGAIKINNKKHVFVLSFIQYGEHYMTTYLQQSYASNSI